MLVCVVEEALQNAGKFRVCFFNDQIIPILNVYEASNCQKSCYKRVSPYRAHLVVLCSAGVPVQTVYYPPPSVMSV